MLLKSFLLFMVLIFYTTNTNHLPFSPPPRADAEAYIQSAKRTWGMWVGIGDYVSNTLDLVAYSMVSYLRCI